MPRPKRWFHVSQDINTDPEFEILCKNFGLGGVRFFLQMLSMLDKTDNHLSLNRGFSLVTLSRSCGTKPKIILGSYRLLIDMNWIRTGVDIDNNQFIYAPNYMKYNKSRVHERETEQTPLCSPPFLSLPLKEKSLKKDSKRKCSLPLNFNLSDERRGKAEVYWKSKNVARDAVVTWDKFIAHHKSKGSLFLDWEAAWQTWYVNAIDMGKNPAQQAKYEKDPYADQGMVF